MSQQDRHAKDVQTNSAHLGEALQWLFKPIKFDRQLRNDCSWSFVWLAKTALLWTWSAETRITERFACAQRLVMHLQVEQAKKKTSWQAFIEVLRRHTHYLRDVMVTALRARMSKELPNDWLLYGYVILGVDGTQVDVPRTQSNEQAFSATKSRNKRCRRKSTSADKGADRRSGVPQVVLTSLFHVCTHLPWAWRIGSRNDSERGHLREMIKELPQNCLVVGDAGFYGYDLTASILASGTELLIRVGSNIRLLKKLGYAKETDGLVCFWPDRAAWAKEPPLLFRLVVVQGPRHPIYLITSVLSHSRLSDRQVAKIYKSRWGIEVYHRHLKQTFGRRRLLSQSAANARVELEWSLLGIWAMSLYASAILFARGVVLKRLSFAGVLHAF